MHLRARWKTSVEAGHAPLALEKRVWRQHSVHFQEFYVPALKIIIHPSIFIHSLLNMGNVPGAILGMADAKMNETGFLPGGIRHLVREWGWAVSQ